MTDKYIYKDNRYEYFIPKELENMEITCFDTLMESGYSLTLKDFLKDRLARN